MSVLFDKQIIALGFFDCVHMAHRKILETARQAALSMGVKSAAITFTGNIKTMPVVYDYDERVKLCVAFGETGPQFQDIFSCVQVVETMQEALDAAVANSEEQDIVLLSPACSSYDQFPNYEVRGALFKEMVRKWLQA